MRSTPYGIQQPPDLEARDYWDEYLEYNDLRTNEGPDTPAGRLIAMRLENAGDMLREMGKDPSDIGYFMEKLSRIRACLKDSDWRRPLYSNEEAKIKAIRERVTRIPANTEVTRLITQVMLDILDRNTGSLAGRLDRLEELIKPGPRGKEVLTMDEAGGYELRARRGAASRRMRKRQQSRMEAGLRRLAGQS